MKKFLSMVLALVMTMSLVTISAGAKSFTDDSKITYKEAVDVVSELKIVDGYEDGAFNPTNNLTRGAAAKIICNLILGPTTASALSADTAPFVDVPTTNNFAGYIAYCAQQKIISGYADGTFRPGDPLTGYAFMKMLLGALGYDATKEGFIGANWSVQVGKLALGIGLEDGNDDFVGTEPVNREEACLYAFNTLQATMVEYENKSSIVIGDITVNTSSEYKDMVNGAKTETIKDDGKMQFAEKYFDDLKKVAGDSDEFERPATTWKIKSAAIGTYSDTPDASYTVQVEMGDVYKDLGLSSNLKVADVDVYEDGAKATSYGITKGDTSKKLGGNGVLTEVFYDEDNDTATITSINTYFGEITATHKASGSKDAYVTVSPKADTAYSVGGNFETEEEFDVDDLVLYTYSYKSGDKGVQSVSTAVEKIDGTLTSFTEKKSVTVGGTAYKVNAAYKEDVQDLSNAVDQDITVYLDDYGYVVFIDTDAVSSNYAAVLDVSTGAIRNEAELFFTDGTTKIVTVASGFKGLAIGDIVSYTTKSNGDYKLTRLAKYSNKDFETVANFIQKGKSSFTMEKNQANNVILPNGATATYANGKTTFLVMSGDVDDKSYNAYTGIANVPDIGLSDKGAIKYTVFGKNLKDGDDTGAATVFFIDATDPKATVSGSSKDVIFVKGGDAGVSHDSKLGDYYEYDAIINGEVTKLKSENAISEYTLFNNVKFETYDGERVYDLSAGAVKADSPADNHSGTSEGGVFFTVNGTDKAKNDVVGLGGDYYTYSRDCKVFRLNEDGDIQEDVYTVSSIYKDSNDYVWFKMENGDVTTIIVQDVAEGSGSSSIPGTGVTGTETTSSADSADALKGEVDGAYTFPNSATDLKNSFGDVNGDMDENIFFKFETTADNQTAILRIFDADGNRMYYEAYKFKDAGPHIYYVQILGTGLANAGTGSMKDTALTVGDYTWEVTSGSNTLASGFFTVEA